MTNKKLLLLLNPYAGKVEMKSKLLEVVNLLTLAGFDVTVHPSKYSGEIIDYLAENAQNFDNIICSGGDGTLNETINGILKGKGKPLLGYIPTGTVNDFASSLDIPKDILEATQNILDGEPFTCDIGEMNGAYFSYVAAFGTFTDVSYQTSQQSKNLLGKTAYILEGIKQVTNIHSYPLKIEVNGKTVEDNFFFGMITNSHSVGGFNLLKNQDISMSDGLLEVTFVKAPKNPLDIPAIINSILRMEPDQKHVISFKTTEIKITAQEKIPWTLDGEWGKDHKEVIVKIHPQAINIIVPKTK